MWVIKTNITNMDDLNLDDLNFKFKCIFPLKHIKYVFKFKSR